MKYVPVALLVLAVLVGCDTNEPDPMDDEIAAIRMEPDSVAIEPGDQVEFSLVALSASGEVLADVDLDPRWWSSDTTVFTVTSDGVATGVAEGTAFCLAEVEDVAKAARFTGRDSAFVQVMLF